MNTVFRNIARIFFSVVILAAEIFPIAALMILFSAYRMDYMNTSLLVDIVMILMGFVVMNTLILIFTNLDDLTKWSKR